MKTRILGLAICLALVSCRGNEQTSATPSAGTPTGVTAGAASPGHRPASNPFKNAYFGETHVHTAYSLDAYIGGARLMPDDAYRRPVGVFFGSLHGTLNHLLPQII